MNNDTDLKNRGLEVKPNAKQLIVVKINELKELVENKNYEQAIEKLQTALSIYEEFEKEQNLDSNIKANILFRLGNQNFMLKNYDNAEKHYTEVITWSEQNDISEEVGRSYHSIGNIFATQESWNKALENYELAINTNEEIDNLKGLGASFYNIRAVLGQTLNLKKRLKYYKKRLKFYEKEGKDKLLGYFYHELALVFNEYDKKDKEFEFLQKELNNKIEFDIKFELTGTYYSLAGFYDNDDEEEKAFEYYTIALELMLKYEDYEFAGPTTQYLELSLEECENQSLKTKAEQLLKTFKEKDIFTDKRTIFDGIEIGEYKG